MSMERTPPDTGDTPLHNAIKENRYEDMLDILAQPHTRLNEQNKIGETPLLYSLKLRRSNKLVCSLIEQGCDVNIPNGRQETPLHVAAQRPQALITYNLIRNGANVNAKDNRGLTPLDRAVANRRDDNIYALVCYGACVDENNSSGLTPSSLAFYRSKFTSTYISQCLSNYVLDFNERDSDGFTHLHRALKHRSPAALDIINRGANVNMLVHGKHCISYSLRYDYCDVFLAIWHRVNLNLLLKMGYYNEECFLEMFLNCRKFSNDKHLKCLYTIFSSPKINALVQQYLQDERSVEFAMRIAFRISNTSLEERLNLIYLFLSYGFEIYFMDICILYHTYVHPDYYLEETIELLLNHGSRIRQNESITDDGYYCYIRADLIMCRICYDNFDVYLKIPDYKLIVHHSEIQKYRTLYKANFEMNEISKFTNRDNPNRFYTVTEVPSLLQLSRDAFRAVVYEKCSTEQSFKVYQTFSRLPVPNVIKDILKLKVPIYTVVD